MERTGLATVYETTQYRVRLARGGHATIRIGEPLPATLAANLPRNDAPWAFVTAWNPRSRCLPTRVNRSRQRELLAALRARSVALTAGVGVGERGRWNEPSVFVVGLPFDALDRLLRPFEQHAIVRGMGAQPAELYWLD